MRHLNSFTLAAVACLSAHQAHAGDPSCDFFQNAVLGTRCAATISLGAAVDYTATRHTYSYADANKNLSSVQSDDTTTGTFKASWTPTSWFTLSYDGSYGGLKQSLNYNDSFYGLFIPQTISGSRNFSYSHTEAQTLVANVNLYDSGPGSQRFVLNAFVGGSYTPSFTASSNGQTITGSSNTTAYGGIKAFDSFRINHDVSITPSASVQFDHNSSANNDLIYPSVRVLLSNDHYGFALGPVINAAYWVSSDNTASHSDSVYHAGGMLVYQPFRTSSAPVLSGLILESTALHALGNPGFVDTPGWKSDEWSISGSAAVHFRY